MSLILLPKDVIELICKVLSPRWVYRLALTCRRMKECLKDLFNQIKTNIYYNPMYYCKYLVKSDNDSKLIDSLKGKDKLIVIPILIQLIKMDRFGLVNKMIKKIDIDKDHLLKISLSYHSWQTANMLKEKYYCTINLREATKYMEKDKRITSWLIYNQMIPLDEEMIEYFIKTNSQAIIWIKMADLLKYKGNNLLLCSVKNDNFVIFDLLEKWKYLRQKTVFDNVATLDNLRYSFCLYKRGYVGKSPLYQFFKEEDENFILWLIKKNITYNQYQQDLNSFFLKSILKYHDKGSINTLYYFYKHAPIKIIKQSQKDGYITEEEVRLNLVEIKRKID